MHLSLICSFLGLSSVTKNAPEVSTSLGRLRGAVLKSRNGREYLSFTKVPYAKPPIGLLRFKDPTIPEPWAGVRDASGPPPACYQINRLLNLAVGAEDCLYVNVYTPKTNGSFPVMVYISPGSWVSGTTGPPSTARYFMDEDVVLVAVNYRIGPLGFLSTEDETIPGNMGLKDMVAAIEWIKREIHNFGGDPDLITAFGFSSGAASVHYLCASPRSRALLKGCISHSGVGGNHWSLRKPGDARRTALTIAEAVGCNEENILQCLQSKTAYEITNTMDKLWFWFKGSLIIHGPVLEPEHNGAFLTEWPVPDSSFPWLTGVTSQEGKFKSMTIRNFPDRKRKEIQAEFPEKKEEYLARLLNIPEGNENAARKVGEKYFPDNILERGIEKFVTDGYFYYPVLHELKNHNGPKYFYVFNVTGGPSLLELLVWRKVDTSRGISHADDLMYFLDTNGYLPLVSNSVMSQPEYVKISQQLVRMWVNFAKHQKPTAEGEQLVWPEFGNSGEYLYMSKENFIVKEFTDTNEYLNFWDDVFNTSTKPCDCKQVR